MTCRSSDDEARVISHHIYPNDVPTRLGQINYGSRLLRFFWILFAVACGGSSKSDGRRADLVAGDTRTVASVPDTRYGYLIVPELKFSGDLPTDTLLELRADEVPQSLRQLALRVAIPRDTSLLPYDTRCTRFFRATEQRYIVIHANICPVNPTQVITHNTSFFLVRFDDAGQPHPFHISREEAGVAALWPYGRTIHGDAVINR